MSGIRLSIIRKPRRMVDRLGREVMCEGIWLKCPIVIGRESEGRFEDSFIDSCSEFSVFPERVWKRFASQIEWLSDEIVSTKLRVAAGEFPFRLGRIIITAFQADLKAHLAPITIMGQFTEDNGKLSRILLGLSDSIFEDHRLILEPGLREAWLEATPPPGA